MIKNDGREEISRINSSILGEKNGADIKRGNKLHGDGSDGYSPSRFIRHQHERERELRL